MIIAYTILLFALIVLLLYCGFKARRHDSELNKPMCNLLVAGAFTIAANLVYVLSVNELMSIIGFSLFSLMIDWMLIAFCFFMEIYTNNVHRWNSVRIAMIIMCGLDSISFLLNPVFKHVFVMSPITVFGKYHVFEATGFTLFYHIHLMISYILIAIVAFMLIQRYINSSQYYRRKYSGVFVLLIVLVILDALCITFGIPLNMSIIFYGFIAVAVYYYAFSYIPGELVNQIQTLMVDRLSVGVIFFDEFGKCVFSNGCMWEQLGIDKSVIRAEEKFGEYTVKKRILDSDCSYWTEHHIVNNETRHFEVACQKIYDSSNVYVGCYFSMLDRTEETRFYERKINMEMEANKAKTDFLSKISHEIRTPINSIYGMNEMILRECEDESILQYADSIKSASDTLIGIINDILDLSRIEAGKMQIVNREYRLDKILRNVCNMTKVRAEENDLGFEVVVGDNIPSVLLGDDVRIEQVFMNLLSNAVKYTNEGKVTFKLEWQNNNGSENLCVYVIDTGIGIRQEDIPKLFKEYERIEEARNHGVQGTGLGLNITSNLLNLMGSKLQVESEYGKGTTFFCYIPQCVVDSKPMKFSLYEPEEIEKVNYEPIFTAPDASVLVVDDNKLNRVVFRNLLKSTKVKIVEADCGKACLELVKTQHFDLIFMDYMMPEMDGVETFNNMNNMEHMCKGVPVVMLTANAVQGAMEEYLADGFADFLSKPVIPEELEKLIKKYLSK